MNLKKGTKGGCEDPMICKIKNFAEPNCLKEVTVLTFAK